MQFITWFIELLSAVGALVRVIQTGRRKGWL